MQYLITGRDGTDADAPQRRQNARPAHLEYAEKLRKEGRLLMAAALLSADDKMIGSVLLLNLENKEELDQYLACEPYVVSEVWKNIETQRVAVPAQFMSPVKSSA